MSTTTIGPTQRPVPQVISREVVKPRETKRWVDWVTTTDHKKIGIMYLGTSGRLLRPSPESKALMIRLQLSVPKNDLLVGTAFNQLLTLHGTDMIFLFVGCR